MFANALNIILASLTIAGVIIMMAAMTVVRILKGMVNTTIGRFGKK